MRTRIWTSKS